MDALRETVTGRVVAPGDEDWAMQRLGWNLAVDQQPAAVVHVETIDDIVAAVRFARDRGLSVAAQPVGHGATNAVDGAIILRTGALKNLRVDLDAGTATVGAGVRARELSAALNGSGLCGLPGSSGDPTVVGYTLGGGLSWFGRKYGQAANRVRRFEVVTADGVLTSVTAASDPDLFWALRGGGGDFAIVAEMEIELAPLPDLYGGKLVWPVGEARAVMKAFTEVTATAPEELTLWAWLLNLPDVPIVPEPLRGRWAVAVDTAFIGTAERAEELIAPIRAAVSTPIAGQLGPLTLTELAAVAAEPDDPIPGMIDTVLLNRLDDEVLDAFLAAVAPGEPSAVAMYEIRHLGGALARPGDGDGAAGHLDEPYLLMFGGFLPVPELAVPLAAGMDALRSAMAPYASGRVPANFSEDPGVDRLYPPAVLERLRVIKQERDPDGVIRGNHPVAAVVVAS
ncbi:FAD-binding oxidoreductase [Jiangella asiatica]|uniref:FAD-binding oxidoreductase n=1 Tax=Jiangella asiatica TaxID=2530372 RepID=A0A4R5CL77_9ACTN|nr:FAD-binding oxidoreductase [Jiangella asiatica]